MQDQAQGAQGRLCRRRRHIFNLAIFAAGALLGGAIGVAPASAANDGVEGCGSYSPAQEYSWRESGWPDGNYQAQSCLAALYDQPHAPEHYDPAEAYVWSYLAVLSLVRNGMSERDPLVEREANRRERLFSAQMDHSQRAEAQDRLIYILSCRGANGLFTLGRLFAGGVERQANSGRLARSERMKLTFYMLASRKGSGAADQRLKSSKLENSELTVPDLNKLNSWADGWMPPFERYPGRGYPGRRYTDHCPVNEQAKQALKRLEGLTQKLKYVQESLDHLGFFSGKVTNRLDTATKKAIEKFKDYIGMDGTDDLSPEFIVQIIQTAAILGAPDAQDLLGRMYYNGIGVECSNRRAYHWFKKAAEQGHRKALALIGSMYQDGARNTKCPKERGKELLAGIPRDPKLEERGKKELERQKKRRN